MNSIKKNALKKLEEVIDPELNISIIDLGLIYDITIKEKKIIIKMTLTTIGCPLISVIEEDIKNKISELGFKKENIKIQLTFDPPWSIEKMTEKGRAVLGI